MLSQTNFLLSTIFSIFGSIDSVIISTYSNPETALSYLQGSSEEPLEIVCHGKSHVYWKLPETNYIKQLSHNSNDSKSSIEIRRIDPILKGFLHAISLTFFKPQVTASGFYTCKSAGEHEKLFLHIEGQQLFQETLFNILIFSVLDGGVIPCGSISKDSIDNITLITELESKQVVLASSLTDSINYKYNPKYGFQTNDTQWYGYKKIYCFYENSILHYAKRFLALSEYLPQPHFEQKPPQEAVFAPKMQLELTCNFYENYPIDVIFSFWTPNGSHIVPQDQSTSYTKRFMIRNTSWHDIGEYKCEITDRFGRKALTSTYIDFRLTVEIEGKRIMQVENGLGFRKICRANHPITWSPQNQDVLKEFTIQTNDSVSTDLKFKYQSRISISNVTRDHEGYYVCHLKDSSSLAQNIGTELYLHVL